MEWKGYLNEVLAIINSDGEYHFVGPQSSQASILSLSPSTDTNSTGLPNVRTGMMRLRFASGYVHSTRWGAIAESRLCAIIGRGRMQVGDFGLVTDTNVTRGPNKNINAGFASHAPATNLPGMMTGGRSGQTVDIHRWMTGMSETSDGTQVAGITKTGGLWLTLPTYADDAAADADTGLPSGALYRTTGGGRAVYAKP